MSIPEPPEPPPEPLEPTERMGALDPAARPNVVDPDGRLSVRDRRALWWQREMAMVALGMFALLLGGVIGYLVGNSNTKTKTVAGAVRTNTVVTPTTTTVSQSTTIAAPAKTVTTPKKTVTTATKTVTTPAKTVTTPGKKVTTPTATRTVTATVTQTVTHTRTTSASTSSTPTGGATGSGTQTFTGSNTQNLGSVQVSASSQLRWSCAGCANTSFTISNSSQDANTIPVNSQGAATGQATVAAGTYTNVTVQGTGPWTVTITPQG